MKTIIRTDQAPAPIGPYNQAVQYGDLLYVSGQIAIDPSTGNLLIDNLEEETHLVMKNMGAVLAAANMTYGSILKATIFIKDMGQFSRINDVYAQYFEIDPPARECVEVARLPKDVNVEISVIAGR